MQLMTSLGMCSCRCVEVPMLLHCSGVCLLSAVEAIRLGAVCTASCYATNQVHCHCLNWCDTLCWDTCWLCCNAMLGHCLLSRPLLHFAALCCAVLCCAVLCPSPVRGPSPGGGGPGVCVPALQHHPRPCGSALLSAPRQQRCSHDVDVGAGGGAGHTAQDAHTVSGAGDCTLNTLHWVLLQQAGLATVHQYTAQGAGYVHSGTS